MDESPPPLLKPHEPFREERWRLVGPSGQPVVCSIERAPAGYEVRVGYSANDILHTYLARSLGFARDYTEVARPLMMETLGLTETKGPM